MTDDYVTWSLDDLSGVLDDYGLDYTVNFEDYDVYDRMLSRETERKGTLQVCMRKGLRAYVLELWAVDSSHFIAEYSFLIWIRHQMDTLYGKNNKK